MQRKSFVHTFWVQSKTFKHFDAKQEFYSNILGAMQDFWSKIWSAKQEFCWAITDRGAAPAKGREEKNTHEVGLFFLVWYEQISSSWTHSEDIFCQCCLNQGFFSTTNLLEFRPEFLQQGIAGNKCTLQSLLFWAMASESILFRSNGKLASESTPRKAYFSPSKNAIKTFIKVHFLPQEHAESVAPSQTYVLWNSLTFHFFENLQYGTVW